jgi:ankyrin repeat protein
MKLNGKELASYSNNILEQYTFGIYRDNALSYCIRINNIDIFKYLIKRDVRPSVADHNNQNAVHFCV